MANQTVSDSIAARSHGLVQFPAEHTPGCPGASSSKSISWEHGSSRTTVPSCRHRRASSTHGALPTSAALCIIRGWPEPSCSTTLLQGLQLSSRYRPSVLCQRVPDFSKVLAKEAGLGFNADTIQGIRSRQQHLKQGQIKPFSLTRQGPYLSRIETLVRDETELEIVGSERHGYITEGRRILTCHDCHVGIPGHWAEQLKKLLLRGSIGVGHNQPQFGGCIFRPSLSTVYPFSNR
jgi:hypothetical protein